MIAGPRGARWPAQETTYASFEPAARDQKHATRYKQADSSASRLNAQATRAVLKLSLAGGRYAHAVWWLISTVAILAQGTSRAVAITQAFYHPWLVVGRVLVRRRARCQHWGGGPPGRPSVCCQLLACAWAPVAGVGGRLLQGAQVARAFAFWAVGDRPGRPQGAASFCHQRVRGRLLRGVRGRLLRGAWVAGVRVILAQGPC